MLRRSMPSQPSSRLAAGKQKKFKVRFAINVPKARHVSLAGDFNQWNPEATQLEESSAGRWETTLSLPTGRYEYKFVVDGEWRHDPTARENIPNQHGSLNSVIEVTEANREI